MNVHAYDYSRSAIGVLYIKRCISTVCSLPHKRFRCTLTRGYWKEKMFSSSCTELNWTEQCESRLVYCWKSSNLWLQIDMISPAFLFIRYLWEKAACIPGFSVYSGSHEWLSVLRHTFPLWMKNIILKGKQMLLDLWDRNTDFLSVKFTDPCLKSPQNTEWKQTHTLISHVSLGVHL